MGRRKFQYSSKIYVKSLWKKITLKLFQQLGEFSMTILGAYLKPFQRVQFVWSFKKMIVFSEITYKHVIYRTDNLQTRISRNILKLTKSAIKSGIFARSSWKLQKTWLLIYLRSNKKNPEIFKIYADVTKKTVAIFLVFTAEKFFSTATSCI